MERQRCGKLFAAALLLTALCLAGSCARRQETARAESKPLKQAELDAMIRKQAVQDPFLRSQVDFGLEALLTGPNRVQVTLTNKTAGAVMVGPKRFALIAPGKRDRILATEASAKLFPVVKAGAGDQVSGELVFPVNAIPPEARLVFYDPAHQPAMAPIRQAAR